MRREQLLVLSFVIIGSIFLFTNISAKVQISRVQVAGSSTTDEFIELYNYGSSTVSLEGWGLTKLTGSGNSNVLVSAFPSSSVLAPFGYYLVAHRDYPASRETVPDFFYSNNSYSLANNNSLLLLKSGEVVDRLDWGSVSTTAGLPAPNPSVGRSLVRLPNDEGGNHQDTDDASVDFIELAAFAFNSLSPSRPVFTTDTNTGSEPATDDTDAPEEQETTTSTPAANEDYTSSTPNGADYEDEDDQNDESDDEEAAIQIDMASLWNFLKINELISNPATGPEWVELYNSGTSTINLAGCTLCDNRESDCMIAELEGIVPAADWFTIFLTGSRLNNGGDSIVLKNFEGETIDRVDYGENWLIPDKGHSLARIADGTDTDSKDDWAITIIPTPDSQNIIEAPPLPPASSGGAAATVSTAKRTSTTSSAVKLPKTKAPLPIEIIWKLQVPDFLIVNSSSLFSVHNSADPRGGEILYEWDFADGFRVAGSRVLHAYASSGVYTITIHATSSQGTLGTKNITVKVVPDAIIPAGIFLSAASPRPEGDNDERIDISSRATGTVDIGSWRIGTVSKQYVIPPSTTIRNGDTLRFFRTATGLVLSNDGGEIFLTDQLGKYVDHIAYDKGGPGQTYTLSENGWEWLPKKETALTSSTAKDVLGVKISKTSKKAVKVFNTLLIENARAAAVGMPVVVSGTVESLPQAPGTNYFYIRDNTGGMQIYSYYKRFPKLSLGQSVRVYGDMSALQGVPRLKISSASAVTILSPASTTHAAEKSISEIDENDFGTLTSLRGEITKLASNYFYLDDGGGETVVSLLPGAAIDKKTLHVGDNVEVKGILEQSNNGFRLLPRSQSDLTILPPLAQTPTASNSTSNSFSYDLLSDSSKLALTAGGVLLVVMAIVFRSRKNAKARESDS